MAGSRMDIPVHHNEGGTMFWIFAYLVATYVALGLMGLGVLALAEIVSVSRREAKLRRAGRL